MKKRGRPTRRIQRKDFNVKYRVGYWPNNISVKRQLHHVIRSHGSLPSRLATLAEKLPSQCKVPYSRRVNLKQKGATAFEVIDEEAEAIVEEIAKEITNMPVFAPDPEARAWILKTKGSLRSTRRLREKKCLQLGGLHSHRCPLPHGDQPKQTARESALSNDRDEAIQLCCLPSVLFHRCVTDETNHRTVLNVLVQAP